MAIPNTLSLSPKSLLMETVLALYIFFSLLSRSFFYSILPSAVFQFVNIFCLVVLLMLEYQIASQDHYTLRNIVHLLLILFCFAIFYRFLGAKSALLLIFIFTSRLFDFKCLAKLMLYVSAFALIVIVGAALAGVITNYKMVGIDGRVRQYLGFFYCLIPSLILSNISLLYIYIYQKKSNILILIALAVANFWMFQQTLSRFSFLSTIAVLILVLLLRLGVNWIGFLKKHHWIAYIMCFMFVIMAILSTVMFNIYRPNIRWLRILNTMLEGRISMTHTSIQKYGIPLFGQDVDWIGNGLSSDGSSAAGIYLYVDNLYFNIIQRAGVIPFLFLCFIVTYSLIRAVKNEDYMLVVLWAVLSIHGLIDNMIMGLFYNSFWLAFGVYFFGKKYRVNLLQMIMKKRE